MGGSRLGSFAQRHGRLAALVAAPVLGLLLAELLLRLTSVALPSPPQSVGNLLRTAEAPPDLLFENQPGGTLSTSYQDQPGGALRVVVHRVNEQGFRGPVVEREREPGSLRIACLGDSHTFGQGVDEGEAWPAVLEGLLRRRLPERRVEVLNCGVNGYDTRQELLLLESRVLEYQPDLVLLQYYLNDTAARDLELGESDWLLSLAHPRREGLARRVRSASRLADVVLDALYRWREVDRYAALRSGAYVEGNPGWERVRQSLRDLDEIAHRRGFEFRVVLFPFLAREGLWQDGEHLTSHGAFQVVEQFCRAQGIPCLNAEPAFAGLDPAGLRVSPHDYHANAAGHALFAAAVDRSLAEAGL